MTTSTGGGRRVGSLYDQLYSHHAGDPSAQLSVPAPVQHLLADLTGPHALMAVAHLLAAAVLGLWIARGERALWLVLAAGTELTHVALTRSTCIALVAQCSIRATLSLLLAQDLLVRGWHGPPEGLLRRPAFHQVLADLVIRRGPPAVLAA